MSELGTFLSGLRQQIQRQYDRAVNRDLSRQNWQGLFGRNVRQVLQDLYAELLMQSEQGMDEDALQQISSLPETLMQYALQKHRTSCALSNFPEEHMPDSAYVAEVIQITEQDWQAFLLKLDSTRQMAKG